MPTLLRTYGFCAALCVWWASLPCSIAATSQEQLEFFEARVRPLLVAKCYECHSPEKKVKGGLRLDTREGWAKGGDSGPAIHPGKPEESLIIKAVSWEDPDLQMPPKNQLSQGEIATLKEWISSGAIDPRQGVGITATQPTMEQGRNFWAYQLPKRTPPPATRGAATPIDKYILPKLQERGLAFSVPARKESLARRLHFDLLGMPPTREQLHAFLQDTSPDATARLIDRLLESPHFGERWARHWFDVVRFGQSVGLRGFVYKEAWRYRDYMIESFNADRPIDQIIREHIAGDLLATTDLKEQQRRLIATTFLAMGNNNLEEQDKKQLEMDVVDDQLDTIGKAFLGQTLGCARCHDHKFDPIPTRDYYAMAAAFRNSVALEHANLSTWIERPLPLPAEEEAIHRDHEAKCANLETSVKALKEKIRAVSTKSGAALADTKEVLPTSALPGVVVDSAQAKQVGAWKHSVHSGRYIGDGYLHDENSGKGEKTLSFVPELKTSGIYEVRFAYSYADSRASNALITISHAHGESTVRLDLREPPVIDGRFVSLGKFEFENNGFANVLVSNEGTRGFVTADAVQFLPVTSTAITNAVAASNDALTQELVALTQQLTASEKELKALKDSGPRRPMAMSVKESGNGADCPVHIRGSVHNLGHAAPRGVLTVALHGDQPAFAANESGRREIAHWIASTNNPLTARVYVNRVWLWLMGEGIVRTPDNFNSSGDAPTHPELLDYLAIRFMEQGWSTKALVREIVSSATYQQSSASSEKGSRLDPENRLWWRANLRRLDAESLRDAMLSTSGKLDLTTCGPNHPPNLAADYNFPFSDTRRSVYAPAFRNAQPAVLEHFDAPNSGAVVGKRHASSSPTQALFLMNNPWVLEQVDAFAARIATYPGSMRQKLDYAFELAFSRKPTSAELAVMQPAVALTSINDAEPWKAVAHALIASIDFRHLE